MANKIVFNPFTGNFDFTGGGSGYLVDPVATETDLPVAPADGTLVVVKSTDHLYVYDATSSTWVDTGLADGNDYTVGTAVVGGITRNVLTLLSASATQDGIVTTGTQTIAGNKTFQGTLKNTALTASRALVTDASSNLAVSSVTGTELGYVSGVTSAIQTQLDSKIPLTQKAAALGVATLDGGGKIPASQLPNTVMELQGFWDASTNTPTLADGTGNPGDVWECNVAGTTDFGNGPITFAVGDWAVYAADNKWHKSINSNAVTSVNGLVGTVVLTTDNVNEGTTNLYFTNERAQDAVGNILTDSSSVDFTYNDAGNTITAAVLPAGVDHNQLLNYVANQHVDHSTVQIATGANSGLSGGGDITATRNLVVDINGTTAKTTPLATDQLLVYDSTIPALRKITRANFIAGIPVASAGDLNEGIFTGSATSPAADVTGLAFANATVRSFEAQVSVVSNSLYESFTLKGIQKGATWDLAQSAQGDTSNVVFSITTAGQVQYIASNSVVIHYRALTLSV